MSSSGTLGTLVFSHGNGFPANTYRQLFRRWEAAGWRVRALPRFGHDPRYPVTSSWPHLREELQAFIAREAPPEEPLVLVGHSMGGYLSLMAAATSPRPVNRVVLLDSPVVGGWRAQALHMSKRLRVIGHVSPGKVSQRRRSHWPDAPSAVAHFRAKATFARWAPGVLEDYLLHGGLEPDPQGVRLSFHRDVETRIYNTLPHELTRLLRRHPLKCPLDFLAGTQSAEIRQAGLAHTRHAVQVSGGVFDWIEGSHLFAMERPEKTAQWVLDRICQTGAVDGMGPAASRINSEGE